MSKSRAMDKFRFELNRAGVRELLRGPEMQAVLNDYAGRIASGGDEVEVYVAQTRAVAEVSGANKNNELLKRMKQ